MRGDDGVAKVLEEVLSGGVTKEGLEGLLYHAHERLYPLARATVKTYYDICPDVCTTTVSSWRPCRILQARGAEGQTRFGGCVG